MTTTLGMTVTLKRYQEQGTDAEDLEAKSHGWRRVQEDPTSE